MKRRVRVGKGQLACRECQELAAAPWSRHCCGQIDNFEERHVATDVETGEELWLNERELEAYEDVSE